MVGPHCHLVTRGQSARWPKNTPANKVMEMTAAETPPPLVVFTSGGCRSKARVLQCRGTTFGGLFREGKKAKGGDGSFSEVRTDVKRGKL